MNIFFLMKKERGKGVELITSPLDAGDILDGGRANITYFHLLTGVDPLNTVSSYSSNIWSQALAYEQEGPLSLTQRADGRLLFWYVPRERRLLRESYMIVDVDK